MTARKNSNISNSVKLLDDAVAKKGSIPLVYDALRQMDVKVSLATLYNAAAGTSKSLKPEVLVALAHIAYNGDGAKFLRALEKDYMPGGPK